MAFSKSNFLALFLLLCSLHLGFANEQVLDDPNAQSDIIGYRLPYSQDCCGYGHPPSCCNNGGGGGGDYCNPPCVQNGCGCVQNPGNRCSGGPVCQPQPCNNGPPCQWQGQCPSCGCARSNVKFGTQNEPEHPTSEPMPSKNEGN